MIMLNQKAFCLITGGSRGIGYEVAKQMAENLAPGSKILLLAKNAQRLKEAASKLTGVEVSVDVCSVDLAECQFSELEKKIKENVDDTFHTGIIVHSAGTLGDVKKPITEIFNRNDIGQYFDVNFVSFVLVNNLFLKLTKNIVREQLIINITSLAAIKSIAGFGLYSPAKAARESFLRSVFVDQPHIKVLNYSPGMVDTDMVSELSQQTWNDGTKSFSQEKQNRLPAEVTIRKLIQVLNEDKFVNGGRIDYYDL